MIKAVLNANVLASALINSSGPSGQIVRSLAEEGTFTLVTSPSLSEEIERVVFYPRVRKYIHASDEEVRQWVVSLNIIAEIVTPTIDVSAVTADPDDDKYVEAALEGHADFIVSGDSHLLSLESYEGIRIVTPRQFLDILTEGEGGEGAHGSPHR